MIMIFQLSLLSIHLGRVRLAVSVMVSLVQQSSTTPPPSHTERKENCYL